jgi:hypothetical protein
MIREDTDAMMMISDATVEIRRKLSASVSSYNDTKSKGGGEV